MPDLGPMSKPHIFKSSFFQTFVHWFINCFGVIFQQLISQQAQAHALENKSPAVDHRKSSTNTDKTNEEEEKANEVQCQ